MRGSRKRYSNLERVWKMSSEGFRGVPGVPDGWELVAIRPAMPADWFVNRDGKAEQWRMSWKSTLIYAIIRKIEQPAKYRSFANAEEFKPHRDRWVLCVDEPMRIVSYGDRGVWFGASGDDLFTWDQAFEEYLFDDDGTPFGVRIDES
jgi:hypothetical protein